jgi:ribosomal protein S12 methylthiotransferase accessory factor
VLDLTSDLAIPVFAAVSRRIEPGPEHLVLGFGAHLDPQLAISRAVAEMDQLMTGLAAQECDGTLDATVRDWLRNATVRDQSYLAPGPFSPTPPQDVTHLATADIADDIRVCEGILASHDLEVLILDQTRPDIGVPVMKVIVPGLRHFRRRLAPGRLYTAPVAAGWLQQPRLETEMNPIGFFL